MATGPATRAYRDERQEPFGDGYFRAFDDAVVSSLGVGTYLGDPTDAVDDRYASAILTALESGCNVLDTAINYRCQRSERVVGRALAESEIDREAVLVATKGGFVPFDGSRPPDPGQYVIEEYLDTGIVDREDLVAGSHCIAPDYVETQLDRSLENLDLESIDLYYVHNPETQLRERSPETVYDQLEATFTRLEERAAAGDVDQYGVATWEAFRVPPEHSSHLSLVEILERARAASRAAGTDEPHFRAIQLPFNAAMPEAFTVAGQDAADSGSPIPVLRAAADAGVAVFTSASIAQGDLASTLPDAIAERVPGDRPVQQALTFARSAPGVTSSLVGMSRPAHVEENVASGFHDPLEDDAFEALFE
ncbi:aldo/keto reductase [Natronococcus pandeyae]|uniref:Aldo/keto reductase n=1 Tax=Natronococcus pandeyae TaxID=2055836 RepID=A0A8J8Q4C9_9EURY|nr:aldo/keto reductase [Natronococcus pandeyae]TYL40286.1 aldo/keto reductase [Natronococcus pandeyae]